MTRDVDVPGLPAKLDFLREHLAAQACVQTHMSWVLLSHDRAFKLLKPVRTAVLDFSTVHAREAEARAELRLNRRLAPTVYLGVRALRWDGHRFSLLPAGGAGDATVVDWLVEMVRLPADRMLDRRIETATVTAAEVDALAELLVPFYRQAPRALVDPDEQLARLRHEQDLDRQVLLRTDLGLGGEASPVLAAFDDLLAAQAPALGERARARRLVDGHGDLRPEHVCLLDPPVVIDCLAFSDRLRQVDPFDELGYLGLECEIAGAAWIGERLVARCAQALDDAPPPGVLALWRGYRALLRARLAAAHLLEASPRTPAKWLPLARRYLGAAAATLLR